MAKTKSSDWVWCRL